MCLTLPKLWSDTLGEFVANQIPIHLIDLHTLQLVSRSDVAQYYRPILAAHLQKHPSCQHASQRDVTRTVFKLVKYAIFSHRWLVEGEPTFQDMPMVSTFADVLIQDDEVCPRALVSHPSAFRRLTPNPRPYSPTLSPSASPMSPLVPACINSSTSALKPVRTTAALPGLTPAASAKIAARNWTNPSAPCSDGTAMPTSASSTLHHLSSLTTSPATNGSHEGGPFKSCSRPKA